jgi:protein phosphatase methylesterase 1
VANPPRSTQQQCVLQFTTGDAIAGCNGLAAGCICANKSFLDNIACCLAGACNQADQDAAVKYAKQICTANGVTVPDQVVCSNSTSPSTTSASSTSASATQAAVTTSSKPNAGPTAGPVAGGLLGAAAIAALAML